MALGINLLRSGKMNAWAPKLTPDPALEQLAVQDVINGYESMPDCKVGDGFIKHYFVSFLFFKTAFSKNFACLSYLIIHLWLVLVVGWAVWG